MHTISLKNFIFFFILQLHLVGVGAQVKTCRLGTLGGFQPQLVCDLNTKYFLNAHRQKVSIKFFQKMLLYGPSGNGKTSIAQEFAKVVGATFNNYSGTNIVTAFQGSGAEKIKEIFEKAKKSGTLQVIFIDEFDAIASQNAQRSRDDNQIAYQTFDLELDAIKDNPKIFVICATNYIEKIPSEVRRRFKKNICEIKNPDAHDRKDLILKFLEKKFEIQFEKNYIENLLHSIDQRPNNIDLTDNFKIIIDKWNKLVELLPLLKSENREINTEMTALIADIESLFLIVSPYYSLANKYGKQINKSFELFKITIETTLAEMRYNVLSVNLDAAKIDHLVQRTDGLCVEDIEAICQDIQEKMTESQNTQINLTQIDQIIDSYQNSVNTTIEQQKLEEQEASKKAQRVDNENRNIVNISGKIGLAATGGAAGLAVAKGITTVAASQTINVASPLVAKAALVKTAAIAMSAGKPLIAKTIAVKATGITTAKAGSIVVAKGLAGKVALAALTPGAQIVIAGACIGIGAYAIYRCITD